MQSATDLRAPFPTNMRRVGATVALAFGITLGVGSSSVAAATGSVTVFPYSGSGNTVAITTGPDGNVWFTQNDFNAIGNRIGVMTTAGAVKAQFPTGVFRDEMFGITPGPDGNVWFLNLDKGLVGRMTTAGALTSFKTAGGQPYGIAAGPDGNLWLTRHLGDAVDRITTAGTLTDFPVSDEPFWGITTGADGNLWFTEDHPTEFVGRITTSGVLTEFPLGSGNRDPFGIAAGPDGNLWVCEHNANKIARITPAGQVTDFAIPSPAIAPMGIATGSDGNLWFIASSSTSNGSILVRVTPSGVMTQFPLSTPIVSLTITPGADGNLWFGTATSTSSAIGRFSLARPTVGYVLSLDGAFAPASRTLGGLGRVVQWSFYGAQTHEVADSSGLALFDSGPHKLVSYFSTTFTAAGVYPYADPLHPGLAGKIAVPMAADPASGTATTSFTITWASQAPPAGRVFDVQIKRPGSTSYTSWQTATTSTTAAFVPDAGSGTYTFRARLRDATSGAAIGYSAGRTISVG